MNLDSFRSKTRNDLKEELKALLESQLKNVDDKSNYKIIFDNDNEIILVPALPTSLIINESLKEKLYDVVRMTLYPFYIVLSSKLDICKVDSQKLELNTGVRFKLLKGSAENQLVVNDISDLITNSKLRLSEQVEIDLNDVNHIAVDGTTGTGKSVSVETILNAYEYMNAKNILANDITIIDPKVADLTRFALNKMNTNSNHNIENLVIPDNKIGDSDLITKATKILDDFVKLMIDRQEKLVENPNIKFKRKIIVIEELVALQISANKEIKNNFVDALTKIAVLGRSSKITLILISQNFSDKNVGNVTIRENLDLIISLGNTPSRYLFDEYARNLAIPTKKGAGAIKLINANYSYSDIALPIIMPFLDKKVGV